MKNYEHFDIVLDPALDPAQLVDDELREALIRKLREIAGRESADLSFNDFRAATGIGFNTIARKFGRWSDFRQAAGLAPQGKRRGRRFYTPERILQALQQVVAECGERVTLAEFTRRTGISTNAITRHFGSFTELRRRAGLGPNLRGRLHYTDEELLEHFHQVALKLGRIPTLAEFNRLAPVSTTTLHQRLGNKKEIERRYAEFQRTRPDGDVRVS